MTEHKAPKRISDQDLDHALGTGVFQTPAGGWGVRSHGVWKAPAGLESRTAKDSDEIDPRFASSAGGSPNV